MRTIRRLSAAFQLLDSYSKGPVQGASILVDGRRVPHVARRDGIYVFTDLPPTPHTYEISAPGYGSVRRTLPVVPEHEPEVVLMPYAPDSPSLGRIACFRLRFLAGGAPLANRTIRAALLTAVGGLRLVEQAKKGAASLALAGSYAPGMVYQRYCTQKDPAADLLLTGYEEGIGEYTLQTPLVKPLPSGTLLRPVWDLETDRDGTAILPAIGLFLQRDEVEFAFFQDGQEQRLRTPPPSPLRKETIVFTA